MGKNKRMSIVFLSFIFLICEVLGYIGAFAAPKVSVVPVVAAISTNYETGDKLNLSITSTGNTKVQYRVILSNEKTKKTIDITKGFTKTYYNPKSPYKISYALNEGGSYVLIVYSKIAGSSDKNSKSIVKRFNVWDKSVIIQNINPVNITVNIDDEVKFPDKVKALMKDGTEKELEVVWDSQEVDTSTPKTYTITGVVKGYTYKVTMNINVLNEKIVEASDVNLELNEDDECELPKTFKVKLSDGTMRDVPVKWNADKIDTSKPGEYTYFGEIDGYKDKVKLNLKVKEVGLSLVSITSNNLKEVILKFNKKLDITTVLNSNFRLFKGTTPITSTVQLLDDDKTVVVTPAFSLDKGALYTIAVDNVRDLKSKKIEKTVKDFTALDNSNPEVLSVKPYGASNICISFSEPVKNISGGTVEVRKGGNLIASGSTYTGYDTNTILVSLYSAMTEGSQYDVTVKGFKDFELKEAPSKTLSFVYKNETSPITAKVKAVNQSVAVVDFNRPVANLTNLNFYHTNAAYTALGIYKDADMTVSLDSNPVSRVFVKFYDNSFKKGYPITSSVNSINILGKVGNLEVIDKYNNKFQSVNLPISINTEAEPLKVLSITQESDTSLLAQFNREVNFTAANVDLIDNRGERILVNAISNLGDNIKYRINFKKSDSAVNIIVKLLGIEDKFNSLNKIDIYTQSINLTDKTPPKVVKVTKKFVAGLEQCLYVFFSEGVNNTALDASNYYLQNAADGSMRKITKNPIFEDGDKIIKISLTDYEKSLIDAGYNLFVKDVEDSTKNAIVGQILLNSSFTAFNSQESKPKVIKIEAISKNTVVVTFDQYLKYVDDSAFKVNGAQVLSMDVSLNSEGKTVVTLTSNYGTENGIYLLNIVPDSNNKLQNSFGESVDIGVYTSSTPIKIQDKIPPQVKYVNGMAQITAIKGANDIIDSLCIEYDKDIDATKLSALSYSVTGRAIKRVYTNSVPLKSALSQTGRYVIIELKTDGIVDEMKKMPQVIQLLDIYDMSENKLSPTGRAY
ncbi:Ig-like domain (group 4) [Caloramator quimbayensis]|uniref:Ig-like domain (Group 4) n=1 Tax=Caloramator quimbayensis TaxID=1147123 RepID=A0A1T4WH52_9CLOT|nr:Ig-like domain-containing protein [Caloramator quimbayensis]SKA76664.1 Ig-like domain (group 4) [Caloramator quimbayensis]